MTPAEIEIMLDEVKRTEEQKEIKITQEQVKKAVEILIKLYAEQNNVNIATKEKKATGKQ